MIPFITFFVGFFLLAIGRGPFRAIPDLTLQLQRQIYIIVAQAVLVLVYPTFSGVFLGLVPTNQAVFVLILPLVKVAMKNVVAWASSHLEEYVPEIRDRGLLC